MTFFEPSIATQVEAKLPFIRLRKGLRPENAVIHLFPHIRPQTAPEAACAYCASIITGNRCESCGAPRRAEKPKAQEWPMLLHDSGPVRDGDGWRRTRITAHPPVLPSP